MGTPDQRDISSGPSAFRTLAQTSGRDEGLTRDDCGTIAVVTSRARPPATRVTGKITLCAPAPNKKHLSSIVSFGASGLRGQSRIPITTLPPTSVQTNQRTCQTPRLYTGLYGDWLAGPYGRSSRKYAWWVLKTCRRMVQSSSQQHITI